MSAQRKHLAIWAKQLIEMLTKEGFSIPEVLKETGIRIATLTAADARIPFRQHAALLEAAARLTGDGSFGLHFAMSRDIRDAGLIGYVGISSHTLGDALRNVTRYQRVLGDALSIEFTAGSDGGDLAWRLLDPKVGRPRQAMEFAAVNLMSALRQVTGRRIAPMALTFAHARSGDVAEFKRFFGCDVKFGRQHNKLKLRRADLDVPIPTSDDRLLAVLRAHCREILAKHAETSTGLAERVEKLLAELLPKGEARMERIAAQLGLSPRSLTRKLGDAGTSFVEILDRFRKDLALRYLRDSELSISQIAFLLGYAEVTAFNHAFKRWTGKPPSAMR